MDISTEYAWSTHQPLLLWVMNNFQPRFIVELGMGENSTPIYLNYDFEKFICLDNDKEWIDHIKNKYSLPDNCEVIYQKLDEDIKIGTFLKQLNQKQKQEIIDYYNNLLNRISQEEIEKRFLFVDNFTCCRSLAINILYKEFDIIAYHDCEVKGIPWYEYYFNEDLCDDYTHFYLKTPKSWTGCFIKNDIYNSLKGNFDNIQPFINIYCQKYNLKVPSVYIEKNDSNRIRK